MREVQPNRNLLEFSTLLIQARGGDLRSAEILVQSQADYLQAAVRRRLKASRLRRIADSVDICQSVIGDLLRHLKLGNFILETPEQLRKLLVSMALNKIIDKARHEARHQGLKLPSECIADPGPSTGFKIENEDTVEKITSQLSDKERWLIYQRSQGLSWVALAKKTDSTPDALRMMHRRAIERLREEFSSPP